MYILWSIYLPHTHARAHTHTNNPKTPREIRDRQLASALRTKSR